VYVGLSKETFRVAKLVDGFGVRVFLCFHKHVHVHTFGEGCRGRQWLHQWQSGKAPKRSEPPEITFQKDG